VFAKKQPFKRVENYFTDAPSIRKLTK